jgi:hypothetical protein
VRKLVAVGIIAVLTACGGGGPTVPTVSAPEESGTAAAPATAAAVPAPPAVEAEGKYEVTWGNNASWELRNTTRDTLYYTAQWTDFENQGLAREKRELNAAPGTTSHGSFDRTCVQVDLIAGKIFAFAFFDKGGKPFNPSSKPEKVTECLSKPTPEPTPTPTPEPRPEPPPTPQPTPSPSPTPPPTCPVLEKSSSQTTISPSSDAAEQGYVDSAFGAFFKIKYKDGIGGTSWTSPGNYPVVLLKGPGHDYLVLTGVTTGQVVESPFLNPNGQKQDFSHVVKFVCK